MRNFTTELSYKTSRSSGAGGQNVNKVESSVTVMWKVQESNFFSDKEKLRILLKLKNQINNDGVLQLTVSKNRIQFQNKKLAIEKILERVNRAIIVQKPRKETQPTKFSIEKRIQQKKQHSEKKKNRKFSFYNQDK